MKRAALFLLFLLFVSVLHAERNRPYIQTLDLSYAFSGFRNHGWGLGFCHEQKLPGRLSIKGILGHMTFLTGMENVYCTSVSISLFVNYYPLGSGLDGPYLGIGSGCDFMHYFGTGTLPPAAKDTLIHITPRIGWKLTITRFLMIDIFTGYKIILADSHN
ncbi:MAG: hypothetical protein LBC88_05845 [Spirochaetaceae bacterium]|jgi:hypothetical protein|nr:hypothetical protein [Spirochaetaceae bacterium]